MLQLCTYIGLFIGNEPSLASCLKNFVLSRVLECGYLGIYAPYAHPEKMNGSTKPQRIQYMVKVELTRLLVIDLT